MMRGGVHDYQQHEWSQPSEDNWNSNRGVYNIPQPPVQEKYPPEATVGRKEFDKKEVLPPPVCWKGLNLANLSLLSVSPEIGNYRHLTALYLLNNCLTSIPTSIFTNLTNLTHLDISSNRLTQIPQQIENLRNLKTFLFNQNNIFELPVEMGRLWKLETLEFSGNPINSPPVAVLQEGTKKIIGYLRDKAPPPETPPERKWITLTSPDERISEVNRVKVLTFNILAESYATQERHPYTPSYAIKWDHRKRLILDQIVASNADIVCLQEVEARQFRDFFVPELKKKGYEGHHKTKSRSKTMSNPDNVDGCAIFYKTSKFDLVEEVLVEYITDSMSYFRNMPMELSSAGIDRNISKDNIALILIVQLKTNNNNNNSGRNNHHNRNQQGRKMIICNTHIHWDPVMPDVKLLQVLLMLDKIQAICKRENEKFPLIIAGDFNSEPKSAVYELINNGSVPPDHLDWQGVYYGKYTTEGCSHDLHLSHCFAKCPDKQAFTNYNGDFMGILDYICFSEDNIRPIGVLQTPTEEDLKQQKSPLPNAHYPSDHIYLLAEFEILKNVRHNAR